MRFQNFDHSARRLLDAGFIAGSKSAQARSPQFMRHLPDPTCWQSYRESG
jgi:hypothetical protein